MVKLLSLGEKKTEGEEAETMLPRGQGSEEGGERRRGALDRPPPPPPPPDHHHPCFPHPTPSCTPT
jgi:hypothetical protein